PPRYVRSLPTHSVPPPASAATYTLPLHDALPICQLQLQLLGQHPALLPQKQVCGGPVGGPGGGGGLCLSAAPPAGPDRPQLLPGDRKSTRLNSSHVSISYAVFCVKKKTEARR